MRFLQFWILPDTPGLEPSLEQRQFTREDRHNVLLEVVGPQGGEVVKVHQNARAFVAALDPGVEVTRAFEADRAGYLYVIDGAAKLGADDRLETGDALKIFGPEHIRLEAIEETELILIDVPTQYTPVGVWSR
jgi:redox-sensitive bicupin YhaK (pirin superfamily)